MDLCDATARMRVGVALQEALSNALYHGNLEVSSDLRQEDEREFYGLAEIRRKPRVALPRAPIHVQARIDRDEAIYVIRDEGPGFDTSSLDRPIDPEDLMRIGGRGMLLIRTFMDEVSHNQTGNRDHPGQAGPRGSVEPRWRRTLDVTVVDGRLTTTTPSASDHEVDQLARARRSSCGSACRRSGRRSSRRPGRRPRWSCVGGVGRDGDLRLGACR